MMIRVLHTANLQLDSPFFKDDVRFSDLRRKEQRALFANIMMYAREKKVNLLFISGDLFYSRTPEKETLELVMREFESSPQIKIIIAPGRRDPYYPGSVYYDLKFPQNVYIFKSEQLEKLEFEDLNAVVYGYAFCSYNLKRNPFAVMPPVDKKKYNFLCGYGSLDGEEDCAPITLEEIGNTHVDYVALGHDVMTTGEQKVKDTYYAMAGAPEGVDFSKGNFGNKGVRIAALEKKDGTLLFQSKEMRFSRRRYEELTLNAEKFHDDGPLVVETGEYMREQGFDTDTILKLRVVGTVPASFKLRKSDFGKLEKRLCYLVLEDETVVTEEGLAEGELKSVFASMLKKNGVSGKDYSDALKLGLQYIEGTENEV